MNGSYRIEGLKLAYPADFTLPYFQKKLPQYDRFLPLLLSKIQGDNTVVDVGANVGDTTLAFLANSDCKVIACEASDKFIDYLNATLAYQDSALADRVEVVKSFVGTGEFGGELLHSGGTATLNTDANSGVSTHRSLDSLVDASAIIDLIKVDVDGFDFDVLLSAKTIIQQNAPLLFWENVVQNTEQKSGYQKLYSFLSKEGYNKFYVFDNTGKLIKEAIDYDELKALNDQLYDGDLELGYFDVATSTSKFGDILQSAINAYKNKFPS